jgi:two-component system, chemotaxis family, protein-glutamate methylesterase/glutaminase
VTGAAPASGPSVAAGEASRRDSAPFRIMVVDDSAVIRGLLIRSLETDPQIHVVASVRDGSMALNAVIQHDIEVVILDIEMPVMDGLTALPKIISARPGIKVIMASTLTRRNADISLRALAAGAAECVTKPGATALTSAEDFKRELLAKVKALARARRNSSGATQPAGPAVARIAAQSIEAAAQSRPPAIADPHRIVLRHNTAEPFEALAIGSSTGGPQALFTVLSAIRGRVEAPIFVTQHMPATFTTILAEHITRVAGWPAAEGIEGETVRPGRVYVAPGAFHMVVETQANLQRVIRLSSTPPENFCRPSVDPMLRSLARVYGRRLLTVILTGMGHDGLAGGEAVAAGGGAVIAQDEPTSVVWGMPGAVAAAGLCSAVLPLAELGPYISRLAMRTVP